MLSLITAEEPEFESALLLMRFNMAATLEKKGIAWDDDWNRKHYDSLDNYSIFLRDQWIGFISMEVMQDALYVHTIQLCPQYQGNIYGMKLFRLLCARALESDRNLIRCSAIDGSSVVQQYIRLGFVVESTHGVLVNLVLSLQNVNHRLF